MATTDEKGEAGRNETGHAQEEEPVAEEKPAEDSAEDAKDEESEEGESDEAEEEEEEAKPEIIVRNFPAAPMQHHPHCHMWDDNLLPKPRAHVTGPAAG